jgi:hypothetical protein
MSATSLYINEKKIYFIARCGKISKTAQGLWTTGSVCPKDGAYIGSVPVGLGHITSIGGISVDHTTQYSEVFNMIERSDMYDIIIEKYPTFFCQDCQCPLSNETPEVELNYTCCIFCGLTQFTKTAAVAKLENTALQNISGKKTYRARNLKRIYLKIQEIGSKFSYQFEGIRAIISSARSKLLDFYNSAKKLPHGGDAFAGACFFAAACELRKSRFGRGQSLATLETITLFASDCKNSTKQFGTKINTTSDRILTLVKRLVIQGLCTGDIPELKRMELFRNCTQKRILLKSASKPVIRLKDRQEGAIVISGVLLTSGDSFVGDVFLVGDYIEKCNGVCLAANMNVTDVIKTIQKAIDNNKLVTLTIRRKSSRKRKRSK